MVQNPLGIKAKTSLEGFVVEMDKRLAGYWEVEKKVDFGFSEKHRMLVKKMLEHASEHNLRKAKRLRGSLVYYSFLLGREKDERIWKAAMGMELVQTALLMHDDFMDEDVLRRGKPTTQVFFAGGDKHYGDSMAVNVGDAVLCLGYELVTKCGFEPELVINATASLLRGITQTAFGQAFDVSLPKMGGLIESEVLALHKAKTAIYTYKNPLMVGGILGGLSAEVLGVLEDYAYLAGVAFQLQDDVLGLFGDEEKTGKSSDSDLIQAKNTLLIVKALESGDENQKKAVNEAWGNKSATMEQLSSAKKAIVESGSVEYSIGVSRKIAQDAVVKVRELRKMNLNNEAIDYLEGIAEYMVEREM